MLLSQIEASGSISFGGILSHFESRMDSFPSTKNIPFLAPLWTLAFSGCELCTLVTTNSTEISILEGYFEHAEYSQYFKPQLILVAYWKDIVLEFRTPEKVCSVFFYGCIVLPNSQIVIIL